ncbi:MAG: TonB-dependent receptor [Henriciella sp.]
MASFKRLIQASAIAAFAVWAWPQLGIGLAIAQERVASDDLEKALEPIIVTAQRRSENLQSVPASISSLDGSFLVDSDIRTLEDLTATVPGFVATNSVSYGAAPLSIRGVGGINGGANFFADEPVAVYVDDVYVARLSFTTAELLDIEQLQVLRGPQGTLFGRNATAGAVLVTTGEPTDRFERKFSASYTDLPEYRLSAVVSGPLIGDRILGRLAVAYSDRQGFGTNLATGDKIGGAEDFTIRGKLNFRASDRLQIKTSLEHQARSETPATLQLADLFNGPTNPLRQRSDLTRLIDDSVFNLDGENHLDSDATTASVALNYDLDWALLESITAYRSYDFRGAQDSDGTQADLFRNRGRFDSEQFTQEIKLSSNTTGALSWIGGAFLIVEESALNPFVVDNVSGLFGLGTRAEFRSFNRLESWSAFLDSTYQFNDKLSITAGLRYTAERKDFETGFALSILNGGSIPSIPQAGALGGLTLPAGAPFPPGSGPVIAFADDETFTDVSPRFVVDYALNDDVMLYASYSQGFKSGGFNSFGLTPAFDPERIEAVEAGVKAEWMRRTLRTNLSVFHYDYSDLQVRIGVPTGGVDIQNAAAAEISGGEFEVTARPFPKLALSASVAYLDAEFTDGTLPGVHVDQLYLIGAPVSLVEQNIVGNQLSRAPEWQTYLSADLELPKTSFGTPRLRVDMKSQTEVFFLEVSQGDNTFKADRFTEIGASLTLTSNDGRTEVSIFGQNLSDDRYVTQVTQLGSFPNGSLNEPMKFGIKTRIAF